MVEPTRRDGIIAALIAALSNESPDSIEFGSAGKGGVIKIYGSFERKEEFQKRIDNAFEMRRYAQQKAAEDETHG